MSKKLKKIFIYGFPGLYGGARTELHHQILLWTEMGMKIHIIPSHEGYKNEALYLDMLKLGVKIHSVDDLSSVSKGDPVLGYCNEKFLDILPKVKAKTGRTIFCSCMTWLSGKEKQRMSEGTISMFLYQNEDVRLKNMTILKSLNYDPKIEFVTFKPYFNMINFPFVSERSSDFFGCGRISRQDADKYAKNTLHIYEQFVAPQFKKALFLGFDQRSQRKIGTPFNWIVTAKDQSVISQQDFYHHCRVVIQPMDTVENWPRIGFEAMSSGSVLVVDNRGGWKHLIEHGKTGWLCNNEKEFIFYASKMAYEPGLRDEIAHNARESIEPIGSKKTSTESWQKVFDIISKLPE